jgi:hypothetical protein
MTRCVAPSEIGRAGPTTPTSCSDVNREGFPPSLPPAVKEALRRGKVPFPTRISYHPSYPERTWATDAG